MRNGCLAALSLTVACATSIQLTEGGSRVQTAQRAELPVGCRLIGDVVVGMPPDAARPRTEEELAMLMRNKVADQGGTHVVLASSNRAGEGEARYYRGRGTGYACEESPPPPEASGGEEPIEDEEPIEGGETPDGADEETDEMLDDILGK